VPNQPRPHADIGSPQPVQAPPAPTTLVAAQEAEIARIHAESVARMKAVAGMPSHTAGSGHRDPLSRPYRLPSGGLWYPEGHGGMIYIAPTRGEQEEVLAGMGDGASASASLRHVAEQVVDFNGLDLGDLLVLDWPALLMHLLAYSAGDDRVFLAPTCPKPRGCGRPSDQTRALADMECVELRLAMDGESTWPLPVPTDPDLAILDEITGGATSGTVEAAATAEEVKEPFFTNPLKPLYWNGPPMADGPVVGWRNLRMRDLTVAEEFASRTGSQQVQAGSKLNNVLLALQIVSIDGARVSLLQAYSWVKQTSSPLLTDLRRQLERRSFGYNMRPHFRCPHCGHSFQAVLPLDGSLFRSRRA